nr:hypothetical protein 6 [Campylobacterota bacterium]
MWTKKQLLAYLATNIKMKSNNATSGIVAKISTKKEKIKTEALSNAVFKIEMMQNAAKDRARHGIDYKETDS